MSKNSMNYIYGACLALILLGIGLFIFFPYDNLQFTFYKKLTPDVISDKDFINIVTMHSECFEPAKRANLPPFLIKTQSHGMDEHLFKARVNKFVEESIMDDRISKLKSFRDHSFWVGRLNDEVVGIYDCHEESSVVQAMMLFEVCVTKKRRGQGFGKQVVHHAVQHCKKPGKDFMLTVYKDEEANIALYKKFHFEIVELPKTPPEDDYNYFNKYVMKYVGEDPGLKQSQGAVQGGENRPH